LACDGNSTDKWTISVNGDLKIVLRWQGRVGIAYFKVDFLTTAERCPGTRKRRNEVKKRKKI
jgi:hypothetical protein